MNEHSTNEKSYPFFGIIDFSKQIRLCFLQKVVSHFPAFARYLKNCWKLYISSALSLLFTTQQIL